MDKFLIAAGGTGAMCARAFIYMAAAGCANRNDTYHILLVDKDRQSDAVTACENLLEDYKAMRDQLGRKNGTSTFPAVKVHKWNFTDEIVDEYQKQTGRPAAALANLTLRQLLNPNYDTMMDQVLATMYTKEEMDTNLEKGFYGHPNIGSPVFDYVQDRFLAQQIVKADGTVQDNTFMQALHGTLSRGKAHVYLLGSLFGGTGATVIPNVVLALRSLCDQNGNNYGATNLILGGSVLMPYFKLPACPVDSVEVLAKVVPADTKFEGQTRDALSYYHESNLLANMMNLMLLGTSELDVTSELFARGGVQTQHFHIVVLLAAAAANRFFKNELGNMAVAVNVPAANPIDPQGELLVWKALADNTGNYKSLTFAELGLTEEARKMEQFLRFSVVVGYYMRLRFDEDANAMLNWNEILGTYKQMGLKKPFFKQDVEQFYKDPVKLAGRICKGFIQFLYDVALSGYDWSGYHVKEKNLRENGYFEYEVTDQVVTTAAAGFDTRWVDLASLSDLKDLLEATALEDIISQKTLNSICSFAMVDANRASSVETKYPQNIGKTYEDVLHTLKLEKTLFGKIKRDDVWFCEIYDELRKSV